MSPETTAMLVQFGPLVLIIIVFYFMLIRPQKKREKAVQQMRANLQVGEEVITQGGIIGTVVTVRDDFVVIETASDRNKIRIAKWAVQANNTAHEEAAAAKKEK